MLQCLKEKDANICEGCSLRLFLITNAWSVDSVSLKDVSRCCPLWPGYIVDTAAQNVTKMTKVGFLRLSYEKQDTLLKLLILSMAAVLCKTLIQKTFFFSSRKKQKPNSKYNIILFSFLDQTFFCFAVWKRHPWIWSVSGTLCLCPSMMRKWHLLKYYLFPDTSTTAQLVSWQKKVFTSFITGLMTGLGILWGELLVAPFIQVGIRNIYVYFWL